MQLGAQVYLTDRAIKTFECIIKLTLGIYAWVKVQLCRIVIR